jgi:hypothetical protein
MEGKTMSLNWNVSNIADSNAVCFRHFEEDGQPLRELKQSTEQLIFLTMVVGMGRITESNHKEFFKRVALFERLHGVVRVKFDGGYRADDPYTLEDIRQHIGLTTNVSEEKPAAWRKRIIESWERDLVNERSH